MKKLYQALIEKNAWLIVVVSVVLAVAGCLQLGRLGVDFRTTTLLDQKDKELGTYEAARQSWGSDEFALVCVTGEDWVTPGGVARLQEILADIKQVPHVGGTMSILDVPLLRQKPGEKLNILTLMAGLKRLGDAEGIDLVTARQELLSHELATNNLISADGRTLDLLVFLTKDEAGDGDVQGQWKEMVAGLRGVVEKWSPKLPERVRLSGTPFVYTVLIELVNHDLRVFGLAAAALFTAGLFLIYRKARFVIISLLVSVVPVLLVVGAMAAFGVKMTVITSNLPLLLFVLVLPYTVYATERYLERRATTPEESQATSLVEGMSSLFVPCLFSTLTTMAGFGAFATSGIIPVRMFGLMMTIGSAVGLVVVFILWPAAMRPLRALETGPAGRNGGKMGLAGRLGELALGWPRAVVAGSAVLLALAVAGALRITAENKLTDYFWPKSEVTRGLEFIDAKLGGTSPLEVMLTSDQDGFFRTADGLAAVAAAEKYFTTVPETGSVRSLTTVVKELKKSFGDAFAGPQLISLVGGAAPELVAEVVSTDGREARILTRMKETAPTLNRKKIVEGLETHLAAQPELKGLHIATTGLFVLYKNMLQSLIESQKETLWFVVGTIFLMLLVLFRSLRVALLVLLPQTLPAAVMLGVMGWARIPLDLVTVMIAAIALGVGVDSAIQYTMRFREEFAIDGDVAAAIRRSHATVGRAIWIATTVIVAGFAVLLASEFFPSVWFGLFTGLAMLMSQFSALITLPALFVVWGKFGAPK